MQLGSFRRISVLPPSTVRGRFQPFTVGSPFYFTPNTSGAPCVSCFMLVNSGIVSHSMLESLLKPYHPRSNAMFSESQSYIHR